MADRTDNTSSQNAHVYTNRQGQTAEERAAYEQAGPDLAQISVAEANSDQYGLLGELTIRAYEPVMADLYSGGHDRQLADVATRSATATIFVALFGEFVIGGAGLQLDSTGGSALDGSARDGSARDRDQTARARIECLAVDPSAQRLGAGRMLVEACIAHATAEGCSSVVAQVAESMIAAASLFESVGFVADLSSDPSEAGGYRYVIK